MNYKHSIFFITLLFIAFYVAIFYTAEMYLALQAEQKIISKEIYLNKLIVGVILLILMTVFSLYLYKKIEKKLDKDKELQLLSRKSLETINDFYAILQSTHDIKTIAGESIAFVSKQFEAYSGAIYLVNYKNKTLQLLDVYNTDLKNEMTIRDAYSGVTGEAFATKQIKKSVRKEKIEFAIPLITNFTVVGVIKLTYYDDLNLEISKSDHIILKIISDTLLKELEHTKNKRYINLIDKYILLSSLNKEGEITFASEAFSKTTGYDKKELIGKPYTLLKHHDIPEDTYEQLWGNIKDGQIWHEEIPNLKKDGSTYWSDTTITPVYDFYENITGYDSISIDITNKKLIEQLSITDGLTNLYNRRYFDKLFPQKINLAKRHGMTLVFALLDIDHFKQYNDTYGHQMGDTALQKVAHSLDNTLKRENDFIFRIGGEEFGLLYFVENIKEGYKTAQSVKEDIEALKIEHINNSTSDYVTISMGLYFYQGEDIDMEQIYHESDKLLYEAKKNGRNQIKGNI